MPLRVRFPRRAHVVAGATFGFGLLAICCGWPSYAVKSDVVTDDSGTDTDVVLDDTGAEASETGDDAIVVSDATGYDVPTAFCADAALRSGEAVVCACGDGGVDAGSDVDPGPLGHQVCTLDGAVGTCLGCPATSSCDGVIAPTGTICVPGGLASVGAANKNVCPPSGCAVERPEHRVAVSRFFFDEHEVTVKRFRDWWSGGMPVKPKGGDVIYVAGDGTTVKWSDAWPITAPIVADATNGATWTAAPTFQGEARPINFVDWPTALAYCVVAANGRLPTEAEWEVAASGRAGRIFPREAPNTKNAQPTAAMLPCDRAISSVTGDCGVPNTNSGGTNRYSVDGVYDLAGGLAEWVLDVPPPGGSSCKSNCYPSALGADPLLFVASVGDRGVRGGSFLDTQLALLRAQARDFKPLATKASTIGFRCVRR